MNSIEQIEELKRAHEESMRLVGQNMLMALNRHYKRGDKMNYVNSVVGGFLFGCGMITAVAFMKLLFHVGLC